MVSKMGYSRNPQIVCLLGSPKSCGWITGIQTEIFYVFTLLHAGAKILYVILVTWVSARPVYTRIAVARKQAYLQQVKLNLGIITVPFRHKINQIGYRCDHSTYQVYMIFVCWLPLEFISIHKLVHFVTLKTEARLIHSVRIRRVHEWQLASD